MKILAEAQGAGRDHHEGGFRVRMPARAFPRGKAEVHVQGRL
jgi:hypothetical protein